ncbi:MAG: ATP-binding cassette domain-containing protein [Phycisphaerae bacterium]|nr:ATP-binding cassette domain-containing protein [Phycisphaerae bacterium]
MGRTGTSAPANRPEVLIQSVHKAFGGKPVLSGIDLSIGRGELVAIVGGSGCGKTVLLKHMTGYFTPDSGRVLVADHGSEPDANGEPPLRNINELSEGELDRIREHWAVVFQRNALLTGTVFHNLAMMPRELKGLTDEEITPRAKKALLDVGLDPELVLHRDREALSGGMAKRVAIARALVMDPVLIVYDEPTSGLDPEMCVQIHELIRSTHEAQPALAGSRAGVVRTSVVVTHDTGLLHRLMPRVVMLSAGKVRFDGSYSEFIASDDEHIRPYLGEMAILQGRRHE